MINPWRASTWTDLGVGSATPPRAVTTSTIVVRNRATYTASSHCSSPDPLCGWGVICLLRLVLPTAATIHDPAIVTSLPGRVETKNGELEAGAIGDGGGADGGGDGVGGGAVGGAVGGGGRVRGGHRQRQHHPQNRHRRSSLTSTPPRPLAPAHALPLANVHSHALPSPQAFPLPTSVAGFGSGGGSHIVSSLSDAFGDLLNTSRVVRYRLPWITGMTVSDVLVMESGELPFPCVPRPLLTVQPIAPLPSTPSVPKPPLLPTVITITGSATAGRGGATYVAAGGRVGRRPSLLSVPLPRLPAKSARCQGHAAGCRAIPVGMRGAGDLTTVHNSVHTSRA